MPVRAPPAAQAPLGSARSRASLFTDPSRFAGVRRYEPGDPLRRIHWRATARVGEPVSRRYEPVHERQVVLAIDLQTVPGPHWLMHFDDEHGRGALRGGGLARASHAAQRHCLRPARRIAAGRRAALGLPSAVRGGQSARPDRGRSRAGAADPLPAVRAAARRRAPAPGAGRDRPQSRRARPGSVCRQPSPAVAHRLRGHPPLLRRPSARRIGPQLAALGVPARIAELEPDWRRADALVVAG